MGPDESSHSGLTVGPQLTSKNLILGGFPSFPNCEGGLSVPRHLLQTRCLLLKPAFLLGVWEWVHTRQRPPRKPRALVSLTYPGGQPPRLSHPAASHAAALGKTLALSWSLLNLRELCHRHQVLRLARRCHFTPMWTSLRLHDSVHLGGGNQTKAPGLVASTLPQLAPGNHPE